MTSKFGKITKHLLVAALVLTPVRASLTFQNDVIDHTVHSNMSMAMDSADSVDSIDVAVAEFCCSEDACKSEGCDPCNLVNPMVPETECVARIVQFQTHYLSLANEFDNLRLTPLLHPPRV